VSFDADKLYALLPAFHRIRDAEQREPLKGLLSVIAQQVAVLEEDLDQLYDDQFIETCAEWVVPYIADLVGTRGLLDLQDIGISQRAQVANTIAYRRRKGTAAVLEQLARDTTRWDARAVEYFQLLVTTQYMNHIRLHNVATPDLRHSEALERISTPFNPVAHTLDVRRIAVSRGKHNIPNVGVHLWRLASYPVTIAPAYRIDDFRYTFNPLGLDSALFNLTVTEDEITHIAERINVPMPISRRELHRDFRDYYQKSNSLQLYGDFSIYYGEGKSLQLHLDDGYVLPSAGSPAGEDICACDLSDLKDENKKVIGWAHMPSDKIAIDPQLGRIAFPGSAESPPADPPSTVHVSYHYGFSAPMGGGEYSRERTFTSDLDHVIRVPTDGATIQDALDELAGTSGVVEIQDNEHYAIDAAVSPNFNVPDGQKIELRAADGHRPILDLSSDWEIGVGESSEFILNGLLISGAALRLVDGLGRLRLRHCTLVPGPSAASNDALVVETSDLTVEIEQCIIVGGLRTDDGAEVQIANSIVDATAESGIAYAALDNLGPGAPVRITNSTIIGKLYTRVMELASNVIFYATLRKSDAWPGPVCAERLQQGCVRFSSVPPGSKVPRRFRCQPANDADAAHVRPQFTSLHYGDAGYCQLSRQCPEEIRQGADDEAEMGAFHDLYQPQREAILRARLDEYLRFGLEAGVFYAS
jgi:hypothetical protein